MAVSAISAISASAGPAPAAGPWRIARAAAEGLSEGGAAAPRPDPEGEPTAPSRSPAADPRSAAWLMQGRLARGFARSIEAARILYALRSRDLAVRAHEAAHISVGGRYVTGGASFSYRRGPDGREYAVGGEVGIDSSKPADPAESLRKMRIVRAAALAPSDPSAADLAVAAAAAAGEAEALAELRLGSELRLGGEGGREAGAGIAEPPDRE